MPRAACRGGSARRPDRAVRALVRGRAAGGASRAQRDDARHRRRRRPARGARRAAQGARPARARLLHQSRQPQGREIDANAKGGAGLLVGRRWPARCASRARSSAVADAEADAYFASRPRGSQIGAWASAQSQVIAGRERARGGGATAASSASPPAPCRGRAFWGGLRLVPARAEFWQGQTDRLHDRLRYLRGADGGWRIERLAP